MVACGCPRHAATTMCRPIAVSPVYFFRLACSTATRNGRLRVLTYVTTMCRPIAVSPVSLFQRYLKHRPTPPPAPCMHGGRPHSSPALMINAQLVPYRHSFTTATVLVSLNPWLHRSLQSPFYCSSSSLRLGSIPASSECPAGVRLTSLSLRRSSRPSPAAVGTQQQLFKQSFSGLTSECHSITTLRGSTQLTPAPSSAPAASSSLLQLPAHSCTSQRSCSFQQSPAHPCGALLTSRDYSSTR
ncbi:unnamed protein product [Acanthosepion pharaonis]|uniref:Uncharacterized protein n=1 Tax=Acanthosepion pharaonis TaxID=158019 RepID=A0A812D099_ACAPH|nr:unnamed protein product [Sepia pharaonis]